MDFGQTLKQLREKAGLAQADLADRAGVSLRTVQSWEQGRRSPVSPDFFKVIRVLGVPADAFAGCDSAPAEDPVPAPATTEAPLRQVARLARELSRLAAQLAKEQTQGPPRGEEPAQPKKPRRKKESET
jgi:transcriptional regulator with XRE-family HTH domain